uniref:transposase n=1 Tax=Hafnia paralvei TaxID=546367 RepID=UPI001F28B8B4|nr:transposase [Hafnia paralvei]
MATDGTGLPLSFCLNGGHAHESQYAKIPLSWVGVSRESGYLKSRPKAVLADKGYSGQSLRHNLKITGIIVVIPFKSNEKTSRGKRQKLNSLPTVQKTQYSGNLRVLVQR